VKGGRAIWKGRQNKRVEVAASTQAFL